MRFDRVRHGEEEILVSMYHASIGTPGCTWDDGYPSMETALFDVANGMAFALRDDDGAILAACSLEEDDVRPADCIQDKTSRSISVCRVVTRNELRGQGLAGRLIRELTAYVRQEGYVWLRLLVSPTNPVACAVYRKAGFRFVGEYDAYEKHWFACEKRL